jgi:hypothetical protein
MITPILQIIIAKRGKMDMRLRPSKSPNAGLHIILFLIQSTRIQHKRLKTSIEQTVCLIFLLIFLVFLKKTVTKVVLTESQRHFYKEMYNSVSASKCEQR